MHHTSIVGNAERTRKGLKTLCRGVSLVDSAPGPWSLFLVGVGVSDEEMNEFHESGPPEPGIDRSRAVEHLDEQECWKLLTEAGFGRLAVAAAGDLDVFPINFVVDRTDLVFRTAEGTKLVESVIADLVAIEADHRDPVAGVAWSVVAKGTPRLLKRFDSIYAAQRLDIKPWIEDLPKETFIRVNVHSITGRRFRSARPE